MKFLCNDPNRATVKPVHRALHLLILLILLPSCISHFVRLHGRVPSFVILVRGKATKLLSSTQNYMTISKRKSTYLHSSNLPSHFNHIPRRSICLPLLVDTGKTTRNDNQDKQPQWNVPLPNSHLPPELTTASLYEFKLEAPVHKVVIQNAIKSSKTSNLHPDGCFYGHVIWTDPDRDDLIGAVGCVGEILIGAPVSPSYNMRKENSRMIDGEEYSGPLLVLARGAYRFRVKQVVSSIPYFTAIVDELVDEDPEIKDGSTNASGRDRNDVMYYELSSNDLISQVITCLEQILKLQLNTCGPPSPLEQHILENSSSSVPLARIQNRKIDAEERLAVFHTFVSSLLDIAPYSKDQQYAVAMIAGELANLPSDTRIKMLTIVDARERLCLVLHKLSSILATESAIKTSKLTASYEENDTTVSREVINPSDLKVGTPQLPPWANQIRKGIRIEYFWNEIEGWCAGTVIEEPIKIIDEILVTVKFDDDGSIYRLPLRGDDKARWRPPLNGNSVSAE